MDKIFWFKKYTECSKFLIDVYVRNSNSDSKKCKLRECTAVKQGLLGLKQ